MNAKMLAVQWKKEQHKERYKAETRSNAVHLE
jgi:hypothetical protein